MKSRCKIILAGLLLVGLVQAGDTPLNETLKNAGLQDTYLPNFKAKLSVGFNYDLLRSLTDVSFEDPKGYMGFNVPVPFKIGREVVDNAAPALSDLFSDTALIKNGDDFRPTASAGQTPNMTVRVDVPMLGGVGSFSNIQNFALNFQTVLGNSNLAFLQDTNGVLFYLRGAINVPLDVSMGWETMSFSYARRETKLLAWAVGVSRHVFSLDVRGKVDADLLGRYAITQEGLSITGDLDKFSSDKVHGSIYGFYDASVWTPSLGLKFWRFSLDGRLGMDTRAKGELNAAYSLPFLIDPNTFQMIKFDMATFSDPNILMALQTQKVDSLTYVASRELVWKMPSAISMNVDIIRNHLTLSYSKLFGELGMQISEIKKTSSVQNPGSDTISSTDSLISLNVGAMVDNVLVMHAGLWNAYINLGVFGIDFRSGENKNVLANNPALKQLMFNNLVMMPILNVGTELGIDWRLLIELDLLPLPAMRTGLTYYF
jgi:hypothetical protein